MYIYQIRHVYLPYKLFLQKNKLYIYKKHPIIKIHIIIPSKILKKLHNNLNKFTANVIKVFLTNLHKSYNILINDVLYKYMKNTQI